MQNSDDLDVERIKYFMNLSTEEKLDCLEQLNEFLREAMPEESKKIWEELKRQGIQ